MTYRVIVVGTFGCADESHVPGMFLEGPEDVGAVSEGTSVRWEGIRFSFVFSFLPFFFGTSSISIWSFGALGYLVFFDGCCCRFFCLFVFRQSPIHVLLCFAIVLSQISRIYGTSSKPGGLVDGASSGTL